MSITSSLSSDLGSLPSAKSLSEMSSVLPASSLLWLLASLSSDLCEGVITNISVIQTYKWFFLLTPFEAIFIGMILVQVSMLQIVGVLPINLNKIMGGDPSGRRKKRSLGSHQECQLGNQNEVPMEVILRALKRVDQNECILRTLCEVQKQILLGYDAPTGLKTTVEALKLTAQCRKKILSAATNDRPTSALVPNSMSYFEEAVELGIFAGSGRNSTNCEVRYFKCSISSQEIIEYIDQMGFEDIF